MNKVNWKEKLWNRKGKLLAYGLLALAGFVAVKVLVFTPREVTVAPVMEQDVIAEVEGTGTVTTKVLARIGSKINGRIERVLVDEGDFVKEGQIVAELEDTDLRRQVDSIRARLEAARASALQAKLAGERAIRLVFSQSLSQEEGEGFVRTADVTENSVRALEADLRYQEFKLSETRVPTFVSGLVTKRWREASDSVVAGEPIVSVADTSVIWVDANIDQRFAGKVRKGQPATVILRGLAEKPFRGRVERVYPQADPVTEEMLVQVAFPLPVAELQVGWWAEVYIEVGKATNALVAPKAAVMPFGNERFVFVAEPNGKVRRVKVEPGPTSPRLPIIAVTGELKAGELVILKPMGLNGGESVRVIQK